jgi:hypothetical protein
MQLERFLAVVQKVKKLLNLFCLNNCENFFNITALAAAAMSHRSCNYFPDFNNHCFSHTLAKELTHFFLCHYITALAAATNESSQTFSELRNQMKN